jgi:hypothetical protein
MLFEHRRYFIKAGRMDQLEELMKSHVIPLLKRSGTVDVGYWTGMKGDELIYDYMLSYESSDHHKKVWLDVAEDEQWRSAKIDLGDDAPWSSVESTLLSPTEYSPLR